MKVAPDAKSVVYSTFLDYAYVVTGVAVLPNGNVWVGGDLPGASYPTTPGAYQQNSGSNGGFLTELDSTGSSLVYSTVIGDSTYYLYGFTLDSNGDIWLAAKSTNSRFPMVAPLQSTFPGTLSLESASVVSQFDSSGKTLKFSTFLGGPADGFANSIAIDPNHRVHVAGAAGYSMYTTPGVYMGSVPSPGPGYSSAAYPYVALIDPTVPAPALCINPNTSLGFDPVEIGTFTDEQVNITSCGTQPLEIKSISSSSDVFTVPASENGCSQSIAVGQTCTLSVRYSPAMLEADLSTLTIDSNASMPTFLPLSGTGAPAPIAVASPTSLTFALQEVRTSSKAQTVTLANSGSLDLTGVSIAFSGASAGSFSQTNNCGRTISAGDSCSISVIFSPTVAGIASATLSIADNVKASPQSVSLTGTATQTPFTITPQANGSTSSTVTAGQPATYALSLVPANGYSGTLTLTCTNLPANASCSFAPASLAIGGGNSTSFSVTIATKAAQSGSLLRNIGLGSALTVLAFLIPVGGGRSLARISATFFLLLFTAIICVSGCGGGSSGSGAPVAPQQSTVAPGTYTVQLALPMAQQS